MAVSPRFLVIGIGTAALAALVGCQPMQTSGATGSTTTPSPSVSASVGVGTATGTGGGTGHSSASPKPRTSSSASPSAPPSASSQTGPRIVYFKVTQQPRCPEGTAVFRAPAVPVIISWKVTGATGVALSVDNPDLVGAYGRYGPEGTETFTFSCGGEVNSIETHVYTIYTTGGDPQRRAEVRASAKVIDKGLGSE